LRPRPPDRPADGVDGSVFVPYPLGRMTSVISSEPSLMSTHQEAVMAIAESPQADSVTSACLGTASTAPMRGLHSRRCKCRSSAPRFIQQRPLYAQPPPAVIERRFLADPPESAQLPRGGSVGLPSYSVPARSHREPLDSRRCTTHCPVQILR
jgi:hypothetical protein